MTKTKIFLLATVAALAAATPAGANQLRLQLNVNSGYNNGTYYNPPPPRRQVEVCHGRMWYDHHGRAMCSVPWRWEWR